MNQLGFDSVCNCLIGLALVVGFFVFMKRDGNHRSIPKVRTRITGRREEPRKSMNGYPLPGCREIIEVEANSYRDVGELVNGMSIEGNVTIVRTHTGRNKWEIGVEDWDVPGGRGLSLKQYQAEMERRNRKPRRR